MSHHVTAVNQSPTCRRCDIATIKGFVHPLWVTGVADEHELCCRAASDQETAVEACGTICHAPEQQHEDWENLKHEEVSRYLVFFSLAHHRVSGLVFCRCERASLACNYRHAGVVSIDFTLFFRESTVLRCAAETHSAESAQQCHTSCTMGIGSCAAPRSD